MTYATRKFLKSTSWIVAIVAVIACGLFYWSFSNFQDAAKLAENGVTTQAQVLQSYSRRERRSSSSGTRYETNYYVRYRFTPEGGEPITKRDRVSKSFQKNTRVGTQIPVTYLPSDPSLHEIEPGETRSGGWMTSVMGLIASGIAAFIGILGWRKATKEGRLVEHGRFAEARIETIKPLPKNRAQLVYWFADANGISTRGASRSKRPKAFDGFDPGDVINIIYDPDKPENNAWDADLGITKDA